MIRYDTVEGYASKKAKQYFFSSWWRVSLDPQIEKQVLLCSSQNEDTFKWKGPLFHNQEKMVDGRAPFSEATRLNCANAPRSLQSQNSGTKDL